MASTFPTRTSVLAVDLTSAGAPPSLAREHDPETENFITARIAGLAKLLDHAGADLLTIGAEFRLGGKKRRDEFLDGAIATSRLGQHTKDLKFAASIPLALTTSTHIAQAVAHVNKTTHGRGGWQVDPPTPEPAQAVENVVRRLADRDHPGTVVVNVRNEVAVEVAAARADVARLRVNTVEQARNLRSAIRTAAADWGRDPGEITVLVDVRTILAKDADAAQSRALFIEDVAEIDREGLLEHFGTVSSLATVWQNWVRAGAADGFTIIPASIPTDVIEVATGLLPELDRRGLRTHVEDLATPAPSYAREAVAV